MTAGEGRIATEEKRDSKRPEEFSTKRGCAVSAIADEEEEEEGIHPSSAMSWESSTIDCRCRLDHTKVKFCVVMLAGMIEIPTIVGAYLASIAYTKAESVFALAESVELLSDRIIESNHPGPTLARVQDVGIPTDQNAIACKIKQVPNTHSLPALIPISQQIC